METLSRRERSSSTVGGRFQEAVIQAETGEAATTLGRVIGGYSLETCLSQRGSSMLFRGVKRGAGEAQPSEAMVRVFRRPHANDACTGQALRLERLEALRTLRHPGIARVIAFGIEGEALYVVTSPFRTTLADALRSQPDFLPLDDIQAMISQLAYALDYAHTQGVTHGNISPQHVALDGPGGPCLCGFELAPLQGSTPPLEQCAAKHGAGRFAPAPAREESCGNDIRRLCALLYALTVAPALPADEFFFSSTQPIDPQLIRPMGEARKGVPAAAEAVVLHVLTAQNDPFPCASHLVRAFAVGLSGEWTVSHSRYARVTKHRQVGSPEPRFRRADLPVPRVSVGKALRAAGASVRQGAAGVPLALMVVLPASAFPIGLPTTQSRSEALAHGTAPHSAIDRQATEPAALSMAGTTPAGARLPTPKSAPLTPTAVAATPTVRKSPPAAHTTPTPTPKAAARPHVDPAVGPLLAMMHRARGVPRRGDCTDGKVMTADDVGARWSTGCDKGENEMRPSQRRLTAEPAAPESLVSTNRTGERRLCDPAANPPGVHGGRSCRSCRPTRYLAIKSLLDGLDRLTRGRADRLRGLAIYVCIGGFAGVVNLAAFVALYHVLPAAIGTTGAPPQTRWLLVFIGATEISMVPNFLANDYITFRHLAGHRRAWWERCSRFHLTCAMGTVLTLLVSGTLYALAMPPATAQAIGIVVVTAFNFALHHAFTYRAPQAAAQDPTCAGQPNSGSRERAIR